MARIGLIHGGAMWQIEPWREVLGKHLNLSYSEIDTYKVRSFKEGNYDIIIVPWAPDKLFLSNNYLRFINFLRRGGVLLSFGEFEGDWLPNTNWTKSQGNKVVFAKVNDEYAHRCRDILLDGLCENDFVDWHDTCHGFFEVPPQGSSTIITDANNNCVMFIDYKSYRGTILATTIDPDFHYSSGGIECAKNLMINSLKWALGESQMIGGLRTLVPIPNKDDIVRFMKSARFWEITVDILVTIGYSLAAYVLIKLVTTLGAL